jgi:hypothetical protein
VATIVPSLFCPTPLRHRLGDSPIFPALADNLDRFLGVHKFSALGLRKAFLDWGRNFALLWQEPSVIPILLVDHR